MQPRICKLFSQTEKIISLSNSFKILTGIKQSNAKQYVSKALSGAIIGIGDRKRGVHTAPSKQPNELFLEQTVPPSTNSCENPQICAVFVCKCVGFGNFFECSLNFPSASYLDRQFMHSGRMSQCYINISRYTFSAKKKRSCNGPWPAERIKRNKKRGKYDKTN